MLKTHNGPPTSLHSLEVSEIVLCDVFASLRCYWLKWTVYSPINLKDTVYHFSENEHIGVLGAPGQTSSWFYHD